MLLGTAVESLLEDGDEQAAALLLDVISVRTVFIDAIVSMETNHVARFLKRMEG